MKILRVHRSITLTEDRFWVDPQLWETGYGIFVGVERSLVFSLKPSPLTGLTQKSTLRSGPLVELTSGHSLDPRPLGRFDRVPRTSVFVTLSTPHNKTSVIQRLVNNVSLLLSTDYVYRSHRWLKNFRFNK